MPEDLVLLSVILVILKCNLRVLIDGAVERINIPVNRLVHALDPSGYENLPSQFLFQMMARELANLLNKGSGFPLCNELGCLHGIHQELQFGNIKIPIENSIEIVASLVAVIHVNAKLTPYFATFRIEQKMLIEPENAEKSAFFYLQTAPIDV